MTNEKSSTHKDSPAKSDGRERPGAKGAEESRTFWDDLADIGRAIPDEELARHPRDGARNLEHYLYGAPKRD